MTTTTLKWILVSCLSLALLIPGVNAVTISHTVVSGTVMTKGLLGILISLGIESWVTITQAYFLYNLISVSIILFIAAMSGPRSEAAFTIIVPIFAALFMFFGWMRLSTPSQTQGLFYLVVIMAMLGVIMYMNDQNRQNYGTGGPGSKLFNIAVFLMLFTASLTVVSGGALFPDSSATQPVPGSCSVGTTCDTYGNFDMTATSTSLSGAASDIQAGSMLTGAIEMAWKMTLLIVSILVGVLYFPLTLNPIMNGIAPGIITNATYLVVVNFLALVVVIIYILGLYEFFSSKIAGSTL